MPKASKKGKRIVYLIPESETRDSHTHHYSAYKTSSMIKDHKKLRMKKFNPTKNKHEWFVESKLPKHTK
tara:strand:- start:1372 stop:1578 length:207 start_codon:yes stop_codon:yes gene_type:complete